MKPKKAYLPDWNLVRTTELTSSEKALMFILKYHYGRNEYTSVGQKCLAAESRFSRSTVGTLLRSIESKGWISITNREYATCEYRLNPDKFRIANSSNSATPVESDDYPLSNDTTGGCTTSKHKGNNTKIEEAKQKNQDFAGEPATPSQSSQTTEPVGREEVESELTSSPTKTNTPPVNVAVLEQVWKTILPQKYPNQKYVAPFTDAECGMLKNFIQRLGPNNDAKQIFELVLNRWSSFTCHVRENEGDIPIPNRPNIPFMLKYVNDAANLLLVLRSNTVRFLDRYIRQEEDRYLSEECKAASISMDVTEFVKELMARVNEITNKFLETGEWKCRYIDKTLTIDSIPQDYYMSKSI